MAENNAQHRGAWRSHLLQDGRKERGAVQQKLAGVDELLAFLGNTPLEALNSDMVAEFKKSLLNRPGNEFGRMHRSRVRNHVRSCNQFLRWVREARGVDVKRDVLLAMKAGRLQLAREEE